MKKILLMTTLFVLVQASVKAQYPDLPGGGGAYNVQNMPTGSYVIAMDNKNQGDGTSTFTVVINNRACTWLNASTVLNCTNTSGILVGMQVTGDGDIPAGATVLSIIPNVSMTISMATTGAGNKNLDFGYIEYTADGFNLQAYGLVVTLLNNNKHLKWVIKPGKAKSAADFSVNAVQVKPTLGTAGNFDFAGGPFVIFQADTAGVAAIVQTFNALAAPDVKLYKTTADVSVDVRYDYLLNTVIWKPKAAILDDGGNAGIHESYMINALVPVTNYVIETTPAFVTGCYTFASEPHNDNAPVPVIQGIRTFVQSGGNFLAECAAVRTYELSTFARFQSTNGFDNANENKIPATLINSNTDLAYYQIDGEFDMSEGGSLQSWRVPSVGNGNPPTNNFHTYLHGTAANPIDEYTNASVSKLLPSATLGGMVFYLGGHSYGGNSAVNINGQRMYLNAFLVPTNPQGNLQSSALMACAQFPFPITVTCGSSAGPTNAYPLTFTLYQDMGTPGVYDVLDVPLGNVVTFSAPNVAVGGINQITAPSGYNAAVNYLIAIRPPVGCLQPRYLTAACITLPVSLVSFTATRNSSVVNLKWSTASEQNSKGFDIERSLGNGNWTTIGYVNSQASGGNSGSQLNYTYNDINNFKGVSQYRLKQIDLDNKSKYSEIRAVRGEDQAGKTLVYPNPTNDGKINVVFPDGNATRDVSVIDMSGRTIKQIKNITNNNIQIENLTPGVYTLRIVNLVTGEQSVEKIVVNKR